MHAFQLYQFVRILYFFPWESLYIMTLDLCRLDVVVYGRACISWAYRDCQNIWAFDFRGMKTDRRNDDIRTCFLRTTARWYGRSAIRMLFCKISEHILDEILISGKVQIIVSADYFTFGRNRSSKYIQHDIRIFKIFQDRMFGYN